MDPSENIAKRHCPKENMIIALGLDKKKLIIYLSNFIFPKTFPIFPLKMTNFSNKKIIGLKQSLGEGGGGYFHISTLKNVVFQLQRKYIFIYL